MLAAATAAQNGHQVTLLEQNEKLGKKLFITGKGRCNITNDCDRDAIFSNIPRNPKFLYSAYAAFGPQDTMTLLERLGVPLKVERGNRVFPQSDKSSDIIRALSQYVSRCGCAVSLNTTVAHIQAQEGYICGVMLKNQKLLPADAVILCTGGASYPSTGSRGDGFTFARELGHAVLPPHPALVPLETVEAWPAQLSGLTLKNVVLSARQNGKIVYQEMGEMLFTHFGVTGPLVLSASSRIADAPEGTSLSIDLKPALSMEQLDKRLLRDLEAGRQKTLRNAYSGLLPQRLLPEVLYQAGLDGDSTASTFSREQRQSLCIALKGVTLTVKRARPLSEAIITRGGIQVKEIKPSTLESKLVKGLYFAGEVLDVDGYTGGFNLQIALSTGVLAGQLK